MPESQSSALRLAQVRQRIAAAAEAAGRKPDAVRLVAVSKTFEEPEIMPVIEAGQRLFGENRVQEAKRKWPPLRERSPGIVLHLIGPVQTNKAAEAVALFDAIQSVDRLKLAHALAKEMEKQGRRPDLFIQVNTGAEPQKAGILPGEADEFIALCHDDLHLPIVGLMCIPPVDEDPIAHFQLLAGIASRNGLGGLSMGMSGDYEAAIACGATHVRVGTAIFGSR